MMPSYIPISDDYGNMGSQASKERMQNWIEFRPKIIVFCDFFFLKVRLNQKQIGAPTVT